MLGGISAGIQAIRLNYVEAFIKFYKGNGTRFLPFGMRKPKEA
jgi:vacuolar-type H+-ATPase subunit I/STV1